MLLKRDSVKHITLGRDRASEVGIIKLVDAVEVIRGRTKQPSRDLEPRIAALE